MTRTDLLQYYTRGLTGLQDQVRKLKRRGPIFLVAELLLFAVFLMLLYWGFFGGGSTPAFIASAFALACYIAVRKTDQRTDDRIEQLQNQCTAYENELAYLRGDYRAFDDGERYRNPDHPFSYDLDIFGRDSLYQRMCRTVTTGGADWLALHLTHSPTGQPEEEIQRIALRQQAIGEWAAKPEQRLIFQSQGHKDKTVDTAQVLAVMAKARQIKLPYLLESKVGFVCATSSIGILILLTAASVFGPLASTVPLLWGCMQLFALLTSLAGALKIVSLSVESLHGQLKACAGLMQILNDVQVESAENRRLQQMLFGKDANAMQAFRQLQQILNALDRRGNVIGLVVFNACFLSDYFLLRRFVRWLRTYQCHMPKWIDALCETDGLISMSTFCYNEPQATQAVFLSDDALTIRVRGLYHPFLGEKAVKNDFIVSNGQYYIITGANMAGKSTFLRSIGVNWVLAINGLPVFADHLEMSVFNLFSSMRTADDLTRGISYFNAELLRLEQLLSCCSQSRRILIILDEILKGTNSLDKLNGSVLFLQSVRRLADTDGHPVVSGVVATHDLELSELANQEPQVFHNFCFEIELSDNIKYSYKITPGVARNQNATYLLRQVIDSVINHNHHDSLHS